jgi:hypothetical protein
VEALRERSAAIAIVLAGLALLGTVAFWCARASLTSRYDALRTGRVEGARLIAVDRRAYEDWLEAINSPRNETLRTTSGAFSASFSALPAAGFSPDIDGYLNLLAADLPDPQGLYILELNRWCHAAGLRMILASVGADAPLYVYRERGVVLGFCLPKNGQNGALHLGLLEDGSYAEYISAPVTSLDDDASK